MAEKAKTWRDSLKDASFRGVPFFYEKVSGEIGRRTTLKEYPARDDPFIQDLGLATRKFTIDMFFIGENYNKERDEMRRELELRGPGKLVHPYWGTITCTVLGVPTFTESTKLGGMAKVSVTFVDTAVKLLPAKKNTKAAVFADSAKVRAAAMAKFAKVMSVVHKAQAVVADVVAKVQAVVTLINKVRGMVAAVLLVVDSVRETLNAISSAAAALVLLPTTLATKVMDVAAEVVDGVVSIGKAAITVGEFFTDLGGVPNEGNILIERARVNAMLQVIADLGLMHEAVPIPVEGEAQQQATKVINAEALLELARAASIVAIATSCMDLVFESYSQAQEVSAATIEQIDVMLAVDGITDDIYGPLVDLRASLSEHFAAVSDELPELEDFYPQAAVPALVLAYQVYGDASREAEILARNSALRDPSSVSTGEAVQVLRAV